MVDGLLSQIIKKMISVDLKKIVPILLTFFAINSCGNIQEEQNMQSGKVEKGLLDTGGLNIEYTVIDDKFEDLYCTEQVNLPQFPGGFDSLGKYIRANIKYPETALKDSIQGKVKIEFIVNKNGTVENAKVVEHVREDIDTISLNTVANMPNWEPASMGDKKVSTKFIIPIVYRLK